MVRPQAALVELDSTIQSWGHFTSSSIWIVAQMCCGGAFSHSAPCIPKRNEQLSRRYSVAQLVWISSWWVTQVVGKAILAEVTASNWRGTIMLLRANVVILRSRRSRDTNLVQVLDGELLRISSHPKQVRLDIFTNVCLWVGRATILVGDEPCERR